MRSSRRSKRRSESGKDACFLTLYVLVVADALEEKVMRVIVGCKSVDSLTFTYDIDLTTTE